MSVTFEIAEAEGDADAEAAGDAEELGATLGVLVEAGAQATVPISTKLDTKTVETVRRILDMSHSFSIPPRVYEKERSCKSVQKLLGGVAQFLAIEWLAEKRSQQANIHDTGCANNDPEQNQSPSA